MNSCSFSFLLPLRLAGRPFLRRLPRPADSSPPPIGSVSHLFAFPPRASAPAGKRVHLLRAVGRVPAWSHRRQSHSAPPFGRRRLWRHPLPRPHSLLGLFRPLLSLNLPSQDTSCPRPSLPACGISAQ